MAKHSTRALRAVHAGFYLSPHTISIGLIGPGHRRARAARAARLAAGAPAPRWPHLDLRVRGIARVRADAAGRQARSTPARWREASQHVPWPLDLDGFARHVQRRAPAACRDHRLLGQRRRGARTTATG
jgi:aspartokinase/homoserine dehydrogenase 1